MENIPAQDNLNIPRHTHNGIDSPQVAFTGKYQCGTSSSGPNQETLTINTRFKAKIIKITAYRFGGTGFSYSWGSYTADDGTATMGLYYSGAHNTLQDTTYIMNIRKDNGDASVWAKVTSITDNNFVLTFDLAVDTTVIQWEVYG